jgi:8-oxo-dGTP pyrophosphatase MutT (NUDIX family)
MMPSKYSSPSIPLPAATVILARQHKTELQVYLLKRHAKSGFMAGHYVFPGGILDPEDWNAAVWQRHVDLNIGDLASRLGGEDLTANEKLAYGVAAIRETLEEAGVFLARRADQSRMDMYGYRASIANPQPAGPSAGVVCQPGRVAGLAVDAVGFITLEPLDHPRANEAPVRHPVLAGEHA